MASAYRSGVSDFLQKYGLCDVVQPDQRVRLFLLLSERRHLKMGRLSRHRKYLEIRVWHELCYGNSATARDRHHLLNLK